MYSISWTVASFPNSEAVYEAGERSPPVACRVRSDVLAILKVAEKRSAPQSQRAKDGEAVKISLGNVR